MKKSLRPFTTAGFMLSTIFAAGCAGNSPVNVGGVQGESPLLIGYRVPNERGQGFYALLEPASSEWKILRFGTELPQRTAEAQEILFISHNGRWVQPAYDYAEKHAYFSCSALSKEPQSAVQGVSTYGPCGASRFAAVNLAATAGRTVIAVPLTFGLAVGTNRTVDVAAVQAALKSTGLLYQVERARTGQQRARAAVENYARASAEIGRQAIKLLAFEQQIVDESGFYNRTAEPLNRLVLVQQPVLGMSMAGLPAIHADADEFSAAYLQFEQRINASTAKLPESYELELQCGATQSGAFAVKLDCAPRVRWSDIKQGQKVALTARILKVAPRELAPSFAHGDDALQIRVDGRELQLVNRSSVYLEVREVSCYVDGEIGTRRWGSVEDQLSLPPMGQLKHPIRQSDVCRDAAARKLQLPALRLEDIKGRSLRFGIAVKYRRAGETVDRTLFQERSLPLDALVRDAI